MLRKIRGGRRKTTTAAISASTVTDHLHEYLKRLRRHNDPEEGTWFTIREVFNGSYAYDDIGIVLQVYGDYVVDSVKALFPLQHAPGQRNGREAVCARSDRALCFPARRQISPFSGGG